MDQHSAVAEIHTAGGSAKRTGRGKQQSTRDSGTLWSRVLNYFAEGSEPTWVLETGERHAVTAGSDYLDDQSDADLIGDGYEYAHAAAQSVEKKLGEHDYFNATTDQLREMKGRHVVDRAKRYTEDRENLDALYDVLRKSVVYFISDDRGKPKSVEVEGRGEFLPIFSSPRAAGKFRDEEVSLRRDVGESVLAGVDPDVNMVVVDYGMEHSVAIPWPPPMYEHNQPGS